MSIFYVSRHGVVMAALATVGAISALLQPTLPARASSGALSCDIQVSRSGSMVGLKAVVSAQNATSGSYRLRVASSGGNSSNIEQSGDFSVDSGSAVVSSVSLGGSGTYTARLSVTADGRTTECSQKVSGRL
jgi:hypothetical protein